MTTDLWSGFAFILPRWFNFSILLDEGYSSSVNLEFVVKVKNNKNLVRYICGIHDSLFFFFLGGGCRKWAEVFQEVVKNWVIGSRWRRSCSVTRKWSQGTLPPHFLLRLSPTAVPCLAFSFSQQTLRPFLISVSPLSSIVFALTPVTLHYECADIPWLWVKRWWELDRGLLPLQ